MKTVLHLPSGTLYVAFSPSPTAEQYTELLELVKAAATRHEALDLIHAWARTNGLRFSPE